MTKLKRTTMSGISVRNNPANAMFTGLFLNPYNYSSWVMYSGSQEITIHHTLALNIDRDGTKAWIT